MKKIEYKCNLCGEVQPPLSLLCLWWCSTSIPQTYILTNNIDGSDKHICMDCIKLIKDYNIELKQESMEKEKIIEYLKSLVKNNTHYITDDRQNKWEVIETSDIEDLILELQTKEEECLHKRTKHKVESDCYPYGDGIEYDICLDCGEKINFKTF